MNNASEGLSPQMALLLVQGVKGQEGVTLAFAQSALDSLVAAGTIMESYVNAVKAKLQVPDNSNAGKMLIAGSEDQKKDHLKTWYGNYAILIYSSMKAGSLRNSFLLDASRVYDIVNKAHHDANARLGGTTPPQGSGSKFQL